MEAEDQLAIIKEEFMKKELEDSRTKSEMEARMEQLELEKQSLQIKIVRISDQFDKGDIGSKEKIASYEAMLQESKRAYMQLDETYKGIIEKAQNEKISAIKQCEKTYNSKIKSKQ